jgi:hypothetical protein
VSCDHDWNYAQLRCTTCGALGRYEERTARIVALQCPCGADATVCIRPATASREDTTTNYFRCGRHRNVL